MPWRDDVQTDAVEYSDRPKVDGPAPNGESVETGEIAEMTVRGKGRTFEAELQFWQWLEADVDHPSPTDSAAGYLAWRVGDQSGRFGVLDGDAERVWFGPKTFDHGGREYSFVHIGEDWRDKLFWNDFFDRIYGAKCQYPYKQTGELRATTVDSLVDSAGPTSEVYEVTTQSMSTEKTDLIQLWRPESCQAVFVAVHQKDDDVWWADRGVLDCSVPDSETMKGYVLSDTGVALSFENEVFETFYRLAEDLRDDELVGLRIEE